MKKELQLFGVVHTAKKDKPNRKIQWIEKTTTKKYQKGGPTLIFTTSIREK
jgi:hypothetical protein